MATAIIGGDAAGAKKALKSTVEGMRDMGKNGKKAVDEIARATDRAAKKERDFEAAVQKSIKSLKDKEQRAKAQIEAEKRLGKAGAGGGGGRRGNIPRNPGGGGAVRVAGAGGQAAGLLGSTIGGNVGGPLGQIGASLSAFTGALGPAAIAAAALGFAIGGVISAYQENEQIVKQLASIEKQRVDIVKAAIDADTSAAQADRQRFGGQLDANIANTGKSGAHLISENIGIEMAAVLHKKLAEIENPEHRARLADLAKRTGQRGGQITPQGIDDALGMIRRGFGGPSTGGRREFGDPRLMETLTGGQLGEDAFRQRIAGTEPARIREKNARDRALAIERRRLDVARVSRLQNSQDAISDKIAGEALAVNDPGGVASAKFLEGQRETIAELKKIVEGNNKLIQVLTVGTMKGHNP